MEEDIKMTKQPIVPVEQLPISRKFEKKVKNELIFRYRFKDLDLYFYSSISFKQTTDILDKVLSYDHSVQSTSLGWSRLLVT